MSHETRHVRAYVVDMLDYSQHIERFVAGKTEQDLMEDLMLQFAVVRAVEVIGEAAKQFVDSVPDAALRFPRIPFRAIYATRNRPIHGYASISPKLILRIASREISPLRESLQDTLGNWPADLT